MAIERFQVGEIVILRGEFRTTKDQTPPNTLIDPTVVTLNIQKPDKVITTFTFGVDGVVTQVSTGVYQYALLIDQEGTYHWRWRGMNGVTSAGVKTGSLDGVREPNF